MRSTMIRARSASIRGAWSLCATVMAAIGLVGSAHALMAGVPPDSPARRVDANRPTSAWTSAVAVLVNGAVYSGVVVAPRYVLTAAHVTGGAAASAVSVQVNAEAVPVTLAATAIETFPGAAFPYDDLALIELAAAVPRTVHIPPIYRQPLLPGVVLTLVGYGASGDGESGATVAGAANVKRVGGNRIDAIRTTLPGSPHTSLFYLFDFDGPTGNGPTGGPTLGNSVETGLAGGDSGSPAFATLAGRTWLVGINNFVWTGAVTPPAPYGFGTGGGGMLLTDPRFIAWLVKATRGTLPRAGGDTPAEHHHRRPRHAAERPAD